MIWLTSLQHPPTHCSALQWQWLTSADSLTMRLRQIGNRHTHLELLTAGWSDATVEEKSLLALDNQHTWIREIVHCYQQQAWVWARVVLPEKTLQKTGLQGDTPQALGDIIFQDTQLQRTNMAVTQLPNHLPYTNQPVWARRSILWFHQQPLLVKEVFLPDFFAYVQNH